MKEKQYPVWFNKDQVELWEELMREGVITQTFSSFVKNAYHEKISDVMIRIKKEGEINGNNGFNKVYRDK